MDPVSVAAASAATAGETAAVATSAAEASATAAGVSEGAEVAVEASEAAIGEAGLVEQLDAVQHSSLESVAARNEAALKEVSQIEINRLEGAAREDAVGGELARQYPEDAGFRIESQCTLRDEAGRTVLDPISGETRRLDFVVVKDGEVVRSVEVTSETADKSAQIAKEDRIREAGGNFVMDRTSGELTPFGSGVRTEIIRRA